MKKENSLHGGDQLLAVLSALANPHRLRIIGLLRTGGRNYVSQLAREIGISRPLLHLHLQKLEEAGLVTSRLELSKDGKALNYYDVCDFAFPLTPSLIAEAAQSLTNKLEILEVSMSEHIESIFLAAFFFPAVAAVLVFFMKYGSAVLQARVRLAQDEAYREIATKASAAQADTAAALSSFGPALADIQFRLAALEKILKEVE